MGQVVERVDIIPWEPGAGVPARVPENRQEG